MLFLSFLNTFNLLSCRFLGDTGKKRCSLVAVLYFNMSFLDTIGLLTVFKLKDWKGTIFLLTVCALSLPPDDAIVPRSYVNRYPICDILYYCWFNFWLRRTMTVSWHCDYCSYALTTRPLYCVSVLFTFFCMTGTFLFQFQWSALISYLIVEHNSRLRGRSVSVWVYVCESHGFGFPCK